MSSFTHTPSTSPVWLIVSEDLAVQKLIGDAPFLATGIVAFAAGLLLVSKRRVNVMTSMIILSSFFSFIAVIVDLVVLISATNDRRKSVSGSLTARIAREMLFATSIALRFLFFWHIVGLPASREVPMPLAVYPPPVASPDQKKPTEVHSGSWTQWGLVGVVLKYFLLSSVIGIGVLEAISRIEFVFSLSNTAGTIQSASSTLEVAVGTVFALKLLGNLIFTDGINRIKTLSGFVPILIGIGLSIGVATGNLVINHFSEYPLGRLLHALELYILTAWVVQVAFSDVGPPADPDDRQLEPAAQEQQDQKSTRRVSAAESFSAIRVPSEEPIAPEDVPRQSTTRPGLTSARSSSERLASWVQKRLSGRPNQDTLLPYASNRMMNSNVPILRGRSPSSAAMLLNDDQISRKTESIYSFYGRDESERAASIMKAPRMPRANESISSPPGGPPPLPRMNVDQYRGEDTGSSSPVYGLNGPVAVPRPPQPPAPPQVFPRSLLSAISTPSSQNQTLPSVIPANGRAIANSSQPISFAYSDISSPQSGGSPFSLTRFPLPPALPSGRSFNDDRADQSTINDEDYSGDSIQFELVPPRAFELNNNGRQQSFPTSTLRESMASSATDPRSVVNAARVAYPGREITSFIGEATLSETEIAEAMAISRAISGPMARGNQSTRLPVGSTQIIGSSVGQSPITSTLGRKPTSPSSDNSLKLPSNPRPARSTPSTNTSPISATGITPSRRLSFEMPRPAPSAPSLR